MPSFTDVLSGASALAADVQQVIDALKGTAGKGIPLSPTAVNDPINYTLSVKNNDAGASKAFIVYKADGTVLLQVDKNGVVASPDGTLGATQLATVTGAQTLTNKTLASSHFTSPVVDSGGLTITAGGETITAGGLTVTAGGITVVTGGITVTTGGVQVTGGNIGVGVAPVGNMAIQIGGATLLGSPGQYGILSQPTVSSAATSGYGLWSSIITQAAAWTLVSAYTLYAADAQLGAASAITTQYGVYVEQQTKGATNWGLYLNGTGNHGRIGGNLTVLGGAATNPAGTGAIRLANNQSILWRNFGNSADAGIVLDGSDGIVINSNVTVRTANLGFYGHAVAAQQTAPAAATDLASVITLANFFRTTFQGNGMVA